MSRISQYVTGFAKKGLSHTSTFTSLKDHNLVLKYYISLKFYHLLYCVSMLYSKNFKLIAYIYKSEVMNY